MKLEYLLAQIKPYVLGWMRSYSTGGQVTSSNVPRFIGLVTPLTSTSWDGDAFSTVGKTGLDLSAVFGVPPGVKAILADVSIRDSASSTGDRFFILSPNSTDAEGEFWRCSGLANSSWASGTFPVPCDANGDVYYQIGASGSGSMNIYLRIRGYWV